MPNFTQREQARSEEFHEYSSTPGNSGPWGGIQSEMPVSLLERYGLTDAQNVIFHRGVALARPGIVALPPFPAPTARTPMGFMDFFNANGLRVEFIPTLSGSVQWNPNSQSWNPITGPAFGGSGLTFSWTVLNQKLCFTQGLIPGLTQSTPLKTWDGIGNAYVSVATAPAALALAEVELHLLFGNTVESGTQFPQRYRWSGVGDPTDYTSFSSGVNDLLIDLGPVYSIKKLGQYGFGWHAGGIVQIVPTGIGTAPFSFAGMGAGYVGTTAPFSVDKFNYNGVDCAAFVGSSNIYIFDQSSVTPIGDASIDGNRRIGARKRIFADLSTTYFNGVSLASGLVVQGISGDPFLSYWLRISASKVWVYHFDERCWSLENLTGIGSQVMGRMIGPSSVVVGPGTACIANDSIGVGIQGAGIGVLDGTTFSENPISMTSGKLTFDDRRHSDTVKKIRVTVQDNGACAYTLTLTNNTGQSVTQAFSLGNAIPTGDDLQIVLPFNMTGLRFQWTLSALAGQPFSVIEVKPMYDIGGEQRSGTVDGN